MKENRKKTEPYHLLPLSKWRSQSGHVVSTGDPVHSEKKLRYVEESQNILGFNQYVLVDFDTGRRMMKSRHKLEIPETYMCILVLKTHKSL